MVESPLLPNSGQTVLIAAENLMSSLPRATPPVAKSGQDCSLWPMRCNQSGCAGFLRMWIKETLPRWHFKTFWLSFLVFLSIMEGHVEKLAISKPVQELLPGSQTGWHLNLDTMGLLAWMSFTL